MKKTFFLILFLVPLLAMGQQPTLTKAKSKERLAKIKKLQIQFDIFDYENGCAIVRTKDIKSKLIDLDGNVLVDGSEKAYYFIRQEESPLILVLDDSLAGFVNTKGEWVFPMVFSRPGECACHIGSLFHGDGCYTLQRDGKFGVIDSSGNILEPFIHDDYIWLAKNRQWILLTDDDNKTFIYSTQTQKLLGGPYDNFSISDYGLMVYIVDDLYGCVDENWNMVLPCQYEGIFVLSKDIFVLKHNGQWSIMELSSGKRTPLNQERLEWYNFFEQQGNIFFCFQQSDTSKESYVGGIDLQGKTAIPFRYHGTMPYGRYYLMFGSEGVDIYDQTGFMVKQFDDVYVEESEDEIWYDLPVFCVSKNNRWALADSNFNLLTPFQYVDAWTLDAQTAGVHLDNGNCAIIDLNGKIIKEMPFNYIRTVDEGLYKLSTNNPDNYREGIEGYVDLWGNTTISRKEIKQAEEWKKCRIAKQKEKEERMRKHNEEKTRK